MTDPILPDHALFQDDLKAYIDGELPWLRRLAVRRHLTHCASCREEITEMPQITEDLREANLDAGLDPSLRAKILATSRLEENTDAVSPKHFMHVRPQSTSKKVVLALVYVGLFVIVAALFFPVFQKTRGLPETEDLTARYIPSVASAPSALPSLRAQQTATGGGYPGAFSSPSMPSTANLADNANTDTALRQVHKEASIGVQVANPEAASDKVETAVKEAGGFVANNTLNTSGDGLKSANMIVKVPVGQFDTVLSQIAKLGSVQSKNVTGEDITDKSSDADQTENVLESDVRTSEARLKALGAKAKWNDQQAARDLRTQLAQARARIFLLKRMATLSTITVDLSQTPKPTAPVPVTNGFTDGLKGNTHDALQSLLSSASALVALVIWLLAYAPLWIPLLLIGRYALKEYRKRSAT